MSMKSDLPNPDPPRRGKGWDWLLWWRVDSVDLDEQVRLYDTLGIWNAMRGISALCLLFSMAMTLLVILLSPAGFKPEGLIDIAVMGVFAIFIYFGHRWAMIGAMVLWTLEKMLTIIAQPITTPIQLLWWAIFMHAFFFAFLVEQRRRALAISSAGEAI